VKHVYILLAFSIGTASVISIIAGLAHLIDIDGNYKSTPLKRVASAAVISFCFGVLASLLSWGVS
jgi:hypothetical protein